MTIEDDEAAEAAETPVEQAQPEPEQKSEPSAAASQQATSGPGNSQIETRNNKTLSTPAVRFLAKKEGIDISQVPGTGKSGRVTKEDLLKFMKGDAPKSIVQDTVQHLTKVAHGGRSPQIAPLYGVSDKD